MAKQCLIMATRQSPLALRQANSIKTLLLAQHPSLNVELLGITTQADKSLDITLLEMGGKGVFVKELEEALLDRRADIAVHSMKDVPMKLPSGLCLAVMTAREEPRDAFISKDYASLLQLPNGASVGTSSLRRQMQLRVIRPDILWKNLRGNIETRIHRLDQGDFDAIILAGAGLKRMDLSARIRHYFSLEQSLPAAGQGALGMECREEDAATLTLIAPLNHVITQQCVTAERALCRYLDGGCKLPIAAYAHIHHQTLTLQALVPSRDGARVLRTQHQGDPVKAETLGILAAKELLQQGADKILREWNES